MKRLIILCTVILMVLLLVAPVVGCKQKPQPATPAPTPEPTPTPTPSPTPPPPRPAPPPPLQVSAIPDEGYYLLGQPVEIEFSYTNTASEPITVSPFPSKIQIMLPRPYEIVHSFASGTREIVLEPGEVVTHTMTWDQKDAEGKQVAPGWYYVNIEDITITKTAPPGKTGLSMGTIARILIQYPQGALEKTIEPNQSQTVNDITITLKRVELTATEARFYAFAMPPGYSPPERAGPDTPPLPHPPPEMVRVHAEYIVVGLIKDAGYSGIGSEDDGIRLIWDNLDPVPSDAKELTFTITHFGDIEGPWEFQIPLE